MTGKNYYKILGIEESSSYEDIKKSYRKLALRYHPDKNPDDKIAEEKFKELAEAYNILSDPLKKQNYDKSRKDPFFSGYSYGSGTNTHYYDHDFNWEKVSWDEVFKKKRNKKGSDISIGIQISIEEMIKGVKKKIKLKRRVKCSDCNAMGSSGPMDKICPRCHGRGKYARVEDISFGKVNKFSTCSMCSGVGRIVTEACKECQGSKFFVIEDLIEINIPSGTIPGMQIVIESKGHDTKDSDISGDLIILIKELLDPVFIRNGTDIKTIEEIGFIDAILGCKIKVELPLGEIIQTVVESNTRHGTILQFPGKGIPEIGIGMRGDFLVEIRIKMPIPQDKEDYDLLEMLRNNKLFKND